MVSTPEALITTFLAMRGQSPVEIRRMAFSWKSVFSLTTSNQLSEYRVVSVTRDGDIHNHTFGYDPSGGSVSQFSGLKRYSNGQWFDAMP